MNQEVTVKRILSNGRAEVEMRRISACGENCAMCGGCADPKAVVTVAADNDIGAKKGDTVIVSSQTGKIIKAAVIVYILPIMLFFIMYFLFDYLGYSAIVAGGLGFIAGILIMYLYNRRVKKSGEISFTVTDVVNRGRG